MLRLDWLTRGNRFLAGLYVPFDRWAGRTRVRDVDADLPPADRVTPVSVPLPRAAESALVRVGYAASQILAYTNLFADDTSISRYGRNYALALRSYREELSAAFGAAANDTGRVGETIAARARAGLLDDVILPFDSLFGQAKDGGIRGFTSVAQAHFGRWLRDSSRVPEEAQRTVADVHARWLALVEGIHGNLQSQWHDSRLVWLPVQLALTEDQYDEQTEVDRLVERAVGRRFTDENELTYLRSSELATTTCCGPTTSRGDATRRGRWTR
jgi:broad specificity phosphatase PhoE